MPDTSPPAPTPASNSNDAVPTVHVGPGIQRTVYVNTTGAVVRRRDQHLVVDAHTEDGTERLCSLPLTEVDALALAGTVHCTMPALRLCLQAGVRVVLLSRHGTVRGYLEAPSAPRVEVRMAQYSVQHEPTRRLTLARAFVGAKLHNMSHRLKGTLRRNDVPELRAAHRTIERFARRVPTARSEDVLLGLEGAATATYFSMWPRLITQDDPAFAFKRRTRRPPESAVDALLGFTYRLLQNDIQAACLVAGLDPHLGVLHRPRANTPAAVLDLMEPFRPVVADSVVLSLINRGRIHSDHFEARDGGIFLNDEGRKRVYKAYGTRRAATVTPPGREQPMPYHRVFELQARRLQRALCTEDARYRSFRI
ncbi:MAG: CRISPR-associated endonuclease Cas1 [Longimonas sp.]|uniref:CRISPR-associated endonuclease Cas1 n=1 Tax=Longimonas sp. TaxID=2039626 RepID=UPI00334C470B